MWALHWHHDQASMYVGGVRVRHCGSSEMPSDKILWQKMMTKCKEAQDIERSNERKFTGIEGPL